MVLISFYSQKTKEWSEVKILVETHIPSFYRVGVRQGRCLSLFGTGPVAQVGVTQVGSGIS